MPTGARSVVPAGPSSAVRVDPARVAQVDPRRVVRIDPRRVVRIDPRRVVRIDLRRVAHVVLLGVALASPGRAQAPDPALPGPFPTERLVADVPVTGGDVLTTDVHLPSEGGTVVAAARPCPVVAMGHGFARSRARHAATGEHLASRGFVVLVPDFAGADHSKNGDDLSALLDWALAENARPGSALFETLDPSALGVSGYSAGGLAAILCGARDARVRAVAPLDPVDSGGLGESEIGATTAPIGIARSEPSACNAFGSAEALYAAAPAPKRGLGIVGATHCDPEDPTNLLCEITCGGTGDSQRTLYRRHLTAWLEHHLRCDDDYWSWVHGADVMAEVAAGRLTYDAVGAAPPCAAEPPGPVTGLRVRRDGFDLILSWDEPPAEPPVDGHRIRRATAFDFSDADVAGESETTTWRATDGVLGPDAAFRVRAFGAGGEGP